MNETKKLYRSTKNQMIGGVCGGIGEYFNIDPTLIRFAFVAIACAIWTVIILYIFGLIIIPLNPGKNGDNTTSN